MFMGPLNETILEANALAEGTRSIYANHLKAAAGSLAALAWIGYTGKGCGKYQLSRYNLLVNLCDGGETHANTCSAAAKVGD